MNVAVGLVYQAILAAYLGLSAAADEFQYAYTIVTFGCVVVMSMVPSVLVPRMRRRPDGSYPLGDCLLAVAAGAAFTVGVLLFSLTPMPDGAAQVLRWSSLSCIFAGISAAAQAIALLERRFLLAAIGPVVNGLAGAGFLWWLLSDDWTPALYGVSVTVGYVAQAAAVVYGLLRLRIRLTFASTVAATSFAGYFAFTIVSKFQPVLERFVASAIGVVGATAALGFGQKVAQGLLLLASFGLSVTAIPALSSLNRGGNSNSTARLLVKVFVATFTVSAVVISAALPFTYPVLVLLFERQTFSNSEVLVVHDVLLLQLPWVLANALAGVGTSFLYVVGWYWRVLISAVFGLIATLAGAVALFTWNSTLAVAAASSLGAIASLATTSYLVVQTEPGRQAARMLRDYLALLVASALCLSSASVAYALTAHSSGVGSAICILVTSAVVAAAGLASLGLPQVRMQLRAVASAEV